MHHIFKKHRSKHSQHRSSGKSVANANNNSLSGSNGQALNGQHPPKRTTSHSPPPTAISRSTTHSPLNPSLNKTAITLTNGLLVNPNFSAQQQLMSSCRSPVPTTSHVTSGQHAGQSFTNAEYLLTSPLYTNPMAERPPPLPPKQKLRKTCPTVPPMQSSVSLPAGMVTACASTPSGHKREHNPSLRTQQSVPSGGQHHKPLERSIANSLGSSSSNSSELGVTPIGPTPGQPTTGPSNNGQNGTHDGSDDCSPPPTPPIRQRMARPTTLSAIETPDEAPEPLASTSGLSMAPLATPDELPNSLSAEICDQSSSDGSEVDECVVEPDPRVTIEDEDRDEADDDVPPSFVSESEVIVQWFGISCSMERVGMGFKGSKACLQQWVGMTIEVRDNF